MEELSNYNIVIMSRAYKCAPANAGAHGLSKKVFDKHVDGEVRSPTDQPFRKAQ